MASIPDNYLDLLQQKKAFAELATVMPDGTPQVTPVWFDYAAGKVRVNTAKGRVKARNLKPGVPVALSIMDPDNSYRYVQIRGRIASAQENGADAHIDCARQEISRQGQVSVPPTGRSAHHVRDRAFVGIRHGLNPWAEPVGGRQ